MDKNPQITRGRARSQQPRIPGNRPPRFDGAQSRPPQIPTWPRPAAHIPQTVRMPRQPAPRPPDNHDMQEVEQVSRGLSNLSTGNLSTPIGRGGVRGRRVIDNETMEYYRMPRPASSQATKQGNKGQPLDLVANYFPINTYTNWTLYQYKINFNPEEDRIGIKRGLLSTHRVALGGAYIFDGSVMFSSTKYESNEFTLTSKRDSDGQLITITVMFTSVVKPNDYTYIQVFNLLLRNCLRHLNLTLVGRNYYDPEAKININQHRLQMWPGYETSIGLCDSGLLLRTEITTKIMRDETVLDFFRECIRNCRENYMDLFMAGVIGSVVLTRYNNMTYKIDDVDTSKTPQDTFKMKDGTQMTYIQYYKTKWGITIRDGRQPLLMSKKKNFVNRQQFNQVDEDDILYLVPELCSLTGITETMRRNNQLMRELADYMRVDPMKRLQRYNNFMNRLQSTQESVETLKKWNLNLNKDLVRFKGRVLDQQKVYGNVKSYDSGNEANWTRSLRALPMFTSAVFPRWVVLYPQQNLREVRAFVDSLKQVAIGMSFRIPDPEYAPISDASKIVTYVAALEKITNQMNPSFILCVFLSSRADSYNIIKRQLCINRAVPSQVVLMKNVSKNDKSVLTKIAIQINCKLGGAPWKIAIPSAGIMIVGFDVCHDKQNKNKSYGALIASLNDDHTKYFSCVTPHHGGEELASHFTTSICGALNAYRKLNNKLPRKIIVYRDGVGDGQISYVHKTEVKLLKDACEMFYGKNVEPPMAFIIVKKRISTRFFCAPRKDVPASNPPPGTVVDSVITDPSMYDFYLVSQHVRFGTVSPTHYNVIVDTLPDWDPNKMQLLTYKLTHMYYNWSGTVRVPAHCQMAHKLAFLAAQSLQGTPNPALNELLYFL